MIRKEQISRLRGEREEEIVAKRNQREEEEEQAMIEEVKKTGHLVGIGGPAKLKPDKKPLVELTEDLVSSVSF